MTLSKTISTLSLVGTLVAAAVAVTATDADARARPTTKNKPIIGSVHR